MSLSSFGFGATVRVWELRTGRELRTLYDHSDRVKAVTVTADGKLAVSGSRDRTLRVRNLGYGCELRALAGCVG